MLAICGVLGVGTLALEAVLPQPSAEALIAARALGPLDRARAIASLEHLNGHAPFHSLCSTRSWNRSVIHLSSGGRILLLANHASWLHRPAATNLPLGATVALAGCPRMLASLLERRLLRLFLHGGAPIIISRRGARSYRFELVKQRPRIELEVRKATLEPVRVFALGRLVSGTGDLSVSRPSPRVSSHATARTPRH